MFNKTILKNKLRIVTEEMSNVRSASIGVWIRCGVACENKDINGITHFCEHMMFKGTSSRSAKRISNEIEGVGGSLNASTGKEYICVFSKILSSNIKLALDILSDIIFNSVYRVQDIEKEKKVVEEEIKMYEDSPNDLIHDIFSQTIFNKYRIGQRIIGTKEVVNSFNRDKLLSYVNKFYTSNNIVISAAGYLKHNEFVKLIEKYFNNIKESNFSFKSQKNEISQNVFIKNKNCEQVHLCIGTKGLSRGDEREYAMAVLDIILGGGTSSRLFQTVRENKALVYSIYTFQMSYSNCGVFGVYAACSPNNTEKVIQLIMKEINTIKKNGLRKQELQRAKEHLKGNLMLALESTSARMFKIGINEFYLKKEISLDEILNKIDKVSQQDISEVMQEFIKKDYLNMSILGPIEEKNLDKYREIALNFS